MAGIPSRMNQSAREQILSSDLNRIGNLAGRELMDAAQARIVRADFYNPATNTFDDFSAAAKTTNATPLSGVTMPPSLDGIAFTFDMALGAGEGYFPASPGSNPDISGNQLLRWDAQTVAWPLGGNPDATNPKICLIVAMPADVLTDVTSRNILLDPSSRTVSPQNVYKTSNPVATLSVVVGTAAASPVSPAVPTGAMALFEVYVPALAADSTEFRLTRRAWRIIEFPGTSQHGIVHGCVPKLSSPVGIGAGAQRIVIDGELLTFNNPGVIPMTDDASHAPGSAPTDNDKPTYLYLCGGRNYPIARNTTVALGRVPVYLIESLTVPDEFGYPTATLSVSSPSLTFPRSACCYIGVRFRGAGTAAGVPAFYEGDWIRSLNTVTNGSLRFKGFAQANLANLAASYTLFTLAGIPATADAMDLQIGFFESGTMNVLFSTSASDSGIFARLSTSSASVLDEGIIRLSTSSNIYYIADTSSTNAAMIMAAGFNMNIPRLAR